MIIGSPAKFHVEAASFLRGRSGGGVEVAHETSISWDVFFGVGEAWMLVQTWKLDGMPVAKSHI